MTQALQEPTERVSLAFQVLLGLANASAILAVMPVLNILIPAQVAQIDLERSATNLALVLPMGALGAMVGNPLGGAVSDRTTSRWGRRRPWIVVGALATSIGLAVLANSRTLVWLAIGWFMVQFFGNMLFAAYSAILPDRVPVNQRGATQAILGVAAPIATIAGAFYLGRIQDFRAGYYVLIAVALALNALFVALYREPRLPPELVPRLRLGEFLASFWINPRRQPNFGLAWLAWLLIWTGYTCGSSGFLFLYLQNITRYAALFPGHAVKEGMSNLAMLQTALGVPLMMLAAILSDRWRRRKPFVAAGTLLVIGGLTVLALFSSWAMVLVAGAMIGMGFWVFYSLGLAMVSQILPSASSRGKDLGVLNIASTVPQIILPGVGAALLNTLGANSPDGYRLVFLAGAVCVVLGTVLVRFIRGVR